MVIWVGDFGLKGFGYLINSITNMVTKHLLRPTIRQNHMDKVYRTVIYISSHALFIMLFIIDCNRPINNYATFFINSYFKH